MKQVYHSNATTNVRLRNEINKSKGTYLEISENFGVSISTVKKWKNRDNFEDKSSKPNTIYYSLSD